MQTAADVDTADRVAMVMSRSPGASIDVLGSPHWDTAPSAALQLIERGRAIAALRARMEQHFTPAVLEQAHAPDIAYVERKAEGVLAFLSVLDGRWRAIRSRWTAYRLGTYQPTLVEQAAAEAGRSAGCRAEGAEGLGGDGAFALRHALARRTIVLGRARRVRTVGGGAPPLVTRHKLGAQALAVASQPAPNVAAVHALRDATADALGILSQLRSVIGWPTGYLSAATFDELHQRAASVAANASAAPRWAAFESARQTAASGIAEELVDEGMRGSVSFDVLPDAFLRAFYMKWLRGRSGPPAARALRRAHARAANRRVPPTRS